MRSLYKVLRSILVTALVLGLAMPAVMYVLLSLPPIQRHIRDIASTELTSLLGVEVTIGNVDITPFNRVVLRDVTLANDTDTIASVRRLGAGISLMRYIADREIVVTFAEVIGLDGRISRRAPGEPLNIQPIIDALSPKDKTKPPTKFDFRINTVVIRRSALSYDVVSAPAAEPGRFDPSHVAIDNLRADIELPRLANDDFTVDIHRLAFIERSGFHLNELSGHFHLTSTSLLATDPVVKFNSSAIYLGDIKLAYNSLATIGTDLRTAPLDLSIKQGTRVVGADLTPFLPFLYDVDFPVNITAWVTGSLDELAIRDFNMVSDDGHVEVDVKGTVDGLLNRERLLAEASRLAVKCNGPRLGEILGRFKPLSATLASILGRVGNLSLAGSGNWSPAEAKFDGKLDTEAGNIALDASLKTPKGQPLELAGEVKTSDFNLGRILDNATLGLVTLDATVDASLLGGLRSGRFDGTVERFDYKGNSFTGIVADVEKDGDLCSGRVTVDDPNLELNIDGEMALDADRPQIDMRLYAPHVDLGVLGATGRFKSGILSLNAEALLSGRSINECAGHLLVDHVDYHESPGKSLQLGSLRLETDNTAEPQFFTIASDLLDGRMEGQYRFTDIPRHCIDIISTIFPSLVAKPEPKDNDEIDDFKFNLVVKPNGKIVDFFNLPITVVDNIDINGRVDSAVGDLALNLSAPCIIKGNTMLRNTVFNSAARAADDRADLYLTTTALFKKDNITLTIDGAGFSDRADVDLSWNYNRAKRYDGNLRLTGSFSRDDEHRLLTRVDINPSEFAVNDTIWKVDAASIDIAPGRIAVDDVKVWREGQFVTIDGTVSDNPDDCLDLALSDIDIDYIFESLAIDNVMFGGVATGRIKAARLLSGAPEMTTLGDGLKVDNLAYNHSLMGNAMIHSAWDNSARAVTLKADISQPNGCHSYVDGRIMPMTDSLDFHFDANRINVGFMKPFMAAFADEVGGYASGKARLWGSFKYIDMVGDIYAEDLRLKIGFTGTEYFATDSVHLTPGHIDFSDVVLSDVQGHHAVLNGWLTHEYFKKPRFEFVVTDADDLLVYDKKGNPQEDLWYGRIYGDGGARITGEPGRTDISVNMTTAPKSTFTFVLTDAEVANEYTFITFHDRAKEAAEALTVGEETRSEAVREFYLNRDRKEMETPSVYSMDISVAVTPDAEMILVMDPVGGDRIRAFGHGDLRLTYASDSEDLRMYGDYTLERGNYNFTLQDIIIKDFTITSGSSILFNGDPYAAQLNIEARYVVQANLSDLDESFLEDRDLNRTNVPVHALMLVTGDIRDPEIAFDLAFPTLNSDIDRKVKSIISTDDMMNRQIIYLLTLSRFYTPDYMASTTKGSELVSVASSTLSSQLSNVLGQISDKWSIAPSVRSDKGDFTDVEFDLALSSTLLNNRLLLNGNFGYRDKSLNNNSFIGDFDIEYLLNRRGTIRLKAYNRYNDQNYFVKSALTTQGVGIEFRHDFDSFRQFFPTLFHRRPKTLSPTDSLAQPESR